MLGLIAGSEGYLDAGWTIEELFSGVLAIVLRRPRTTKAAPKGGLVPLSLSAPLSRDAEAGVVALIRRSTSFPGVQRILVIRLVWATIGRHSASRQGQQSTNGEADSNDPLHGDVLL